jgi:hypothetical protein
VETRFRIAPLVDERAALHHILTCACARHRTWVARTCTVHADTRGTCERGRVRDVCRFRGTVSERDALQRLLGAHPLEGFESFWTRRITLQCTWTWSGERALGLRMSCMTVLVIMCAYAPSRTRAGLISRATMQRP